MKINYLIVVSALILGACTVNKPIEVLHPAIIDMPHDVQRIYVVNKSEVAKGGNRNGQVLEGIISGEGIRGDKYGAEAAVNGFSEFMRQNNKLEIANGQPLKVISQGKDPRHTSLSKFFIDSVCTATNSQAVVSLEYFDTDHPNGITDVVQGTYYNNIRVKSKWVLYTSNGEAYDTRALQSNWVNTPEYYGIDLPGNNMVTERAGYVTGIDYARHLVPNFQFEPRVLYSAGSPEIKQGLRAADLVEWQQAEELWLMAANKKQKPKIIARLLHNVAVAYEVKGDLERAHDFGSKAYMMRSTSVTRDYVFRLKDRIRAQEILVDQAID